MIHATLARAALAAAAVLIGLGAATAGEPEENLSAALNVESSLDAPVTLRADLVGYDSSTRLFVARGNVEIAHGGRALRADSLSYAVDSGVVEASGNILLREPDGTIAQAEHMALSGDLRQRAVRQIHIFMRDHAQLAARAATSAAEDRTVLEGAVYSTCALCPDDPDKPPIWQMRAERIVHDRAAGRITYRNVKLEMFGVPVLYTPWLAHPDAMSPRKSGLLPPRYTRSDTLGVELSAPYFWAIAPDRDATITPVITSEHGLVLSGEYRQRMRAGGLDISGSVVEADRAVAREDGSTTVRTDRIRGHLRADGQFAINESWRWGFDVDRASDKTYLSEFDLFGTPDNVLTSNAHAEYFSGRDYAVINMYAFQDLRSDAGLDRPPRILPLAEHEMITRPDDFGGRWRLNSNFRSLRQDDISRSNRLSVRGEYAAPLMTEIGLLTTVSGSVRGDLYDVKHARARDDLGRALSSGTTSRLHPQLAVTGRYPFFRPTDDGGQIIEPIMAVFAAPKGGNPSDIVNDDSAISEQDDTNLFSQDRLPGLDRVEGGLRVAYGMRMGQYLPTGQRLEMMLGQSYRVTRDADMEAESGIERGASDVFGRVGLNLFSGVNTDYRFRIDDDTGDILRSEVGFSANPGDWRVSGSYTLIDSDTAADSADTMNQLHLGVGTSLARGWTADAYSTVNLGKNADDKAGVLESGLDLAYEDECLIFTTGYKRSHLDRTTGSANHTYSLRLTLKGLSDS